MSSLSRLQNLVSPLGGLFSGVSRLPGQPGEPACFIYTALLNDLTRSLSHVHRATGGKSTTGEVDGAGGAMETEIAMIRALAEGVERYSSCVYSEDQFIWATADELGEDALDLDQVPRCSDAELSHSLCPISAARKDAPIRWVRGLSLMTGRLVWVPAIMTYLHLPYLSAGERFTLPISTGCAIHGTLEQALVSAICEVIERDAISLTWLQQLPLPQIELDAIPDELKPYLDVYRRSNFQTHFFDATTDLGIPTVYSIDYAPNNREVSALVMCATDMDPARALAKVVRESASSRIAMQTPRRIPEDPNYFMNVVDGAKYMGAAERIGAFEFLLQSPNRRKLSDMPRLDTGDPTGDVCLLLQRLRAQQMEAFAVDLTTDEALQAGLRAVRIIIPQLQPLSFSYRARYLGHPRLYDGPARMGYAVRREADLNPWPQPFA